MTTESTQRRAREEGSRRLIVEARNADEAISQFVLQNASELVSISRPGQGHESIATVKKDDSVYLVRVYSA